MNPQEVKVSSCAEGKPEARETVLDARRTTGFLALSVSPKWGENHEANYLLSSHHLHQPTPVYTDLATIWGCEMVHEVSSLYHRRTDKHEAKPGTR